MFTLSQIFSLPFSSSALAQNLCSLDDAELNRIYQQLVPREQRLHTECDARLHQVAVEISQTFRASAAYQGAFTRFQRHIPSPTGARIRLIDQTIAELRGVLRRNNFPEGRLIEQPNHIGLSFSETNDFCIWHIVADLNLLDGRGNGIRIGAANMARISPSGFTDLELEVRNTSTFDVTSNGTVADNLKTWFTLRQTFPPSRPPLPQRNATLPYSNIQGNRSNAFSSAILEWGRRWGDCRSANFKTHHETNEIGTGAD